MPKVPEKTDFPVSQVRRYLEPGPIVLVSSKWQGATNIMTLGWHTILEFSPSPGRPDDLRRQSQPPHDPRKPGMRGEPADDGDTVVGIGNTSGAEIDKFASSISRGKRRARSMRR